MASYIKSVRILLSRSFSCLTVAMLFVTQAIKGGHPAEAYLRVEKCGHAYSIKGCANNPLSRYNRHVQESVVPRIWQLVRLEHARAILMNV